MQLRHRERRASPVRIPQIPNRIALISVARAGEALRYDAGRLGHTS